MPDDTVKYYPVVARLLLTLGGRPLVTYRGAIVSRKSGFWVNYDLVHRFVIEYKGASYSCSTDEPLYLKNYRTQMIDYVKRKWQRAERHTTRTLQPVVEIEIDLRGVLVQFAK